MWEEGKVEAWGPALKNLQRTGAFPENPGGVSSPLAVWTPAWEGAPLAWTAVPFVTWACVGSEYTSRSACVLWGMLGTGPVRL